MHDGKCRIQRWIALLWPPDEGVYLRIWSRHSWSETWQHLQGETVFCVCVCVHKSVWVNICSTSTAPLERHTHTHTHKIQFHLEGVVALVAVATEENFALATVAETEAGRFCWTIITSCLIKIIQIQPAWAETHASSSLQATEEGVCVCVCVWFSHCAHTHTHTHSVKGRSRRRRESRCVCSKNVQPKPDQAAESVCVCVCVCVWVCARMCVSTISKNTSRSAVIKSKVHVHDVRLVKRTTCLWGAVWSNRLHPVYSVTALE